MIKSFNALLVTVTLFCGCKSKTHVFPSVPKELAHRYEESLLLDHAALNCWHWRPLPDSLSLLGYDGARFTARLTDVPSNLRFVHSYDMVKLPIDKGTKLPDPALEVRSGGGLPASCDVVWDIFWTRKDSNTIEFHDRFQMMEEKDGKSSTVHNRPIVNVRLVQLPEGIQSTGGGAGTAVFRTLPVKFEERQTLYTLIYTDNSATNLRSGTGVELQWYFECGTPRTP